jgi:hypothetical protein
MKNKFILSAIGGSLLLGAASLSAQIMDTNVNTNSPPANQAVKYQVMPENDRSLGERALFPPGLREKLRLTDDERAELRPIEADFAKTSQEYQAANQPRIDAATEAIRLARGRTRRKSRPRATSCNKRGPDCRNTGTNPSGRSSCC